MKYCKKCGWKLEYRPRSFQEHIREIIGDNKERGKWICPNCDSIKFSKNTKKNLK